VRDQLDLLRRRPADLLVDDIGGAGDPQKHDDGFTPGGPSSGILCQSSAGDNKN